MAVTSRGRTELPMPMLKKWKDTETSPERTKIWKEPKPKPKKMERNVPVVYYLSRNGNLEHPHFMDVPLTSSEGLFLTDFINRLNFLRGKGMAGMYSWSSKRSYKNGFVWHDLSENDFIHPVHGQEYVLKGSELLQGSLSITTSQETDSSSSEKQLEALKLGDDCEFPVVHQRRNQSWSSIDLHEYKVYKAEATGESAGKAANASTQTEEKRRRRRTIREAEEEEEQQEKIQSVEEESYQNQTTELSREEISPPPSSSSPETLESLIKADGRIIKTSRDAINQISNNHNSSGRIKASSVLMQLISCGSISMKEDFDSSMSAKQQGGFSLVSHYRARLPRGGGTNQVAKEAESLMENLNPVFSGIRLEDKEYFSGSLIETKKDDFPAVLKRSSSYNADRSSKLDFEEKEGEVRAKCIPRKPKRAMKKEGNSEISRTNLHRSKRLTHEQSVVNK